MGKALKVFVILNLALSAFVIYIGIQAFNGRKILKAEALELEKSLSRLSGNLQWGAKVPWENEGEEKQVAFRFSQPARAEGLANLRNELEPLGRFATTREAQLAQRHNELVVTRSTLMDTRDTLATRERELAAAQKQESDLTAELAGTNAALSDARNQVSNLETGKSDRELKITSKNNTLTELNNTLASLEIDLESRIQERDNAKDEYERCRIGEAGEKSKEIDVRGSKGLVMAVNKDWEYVVIDKGNLKVEPNFQAYVHRGKEYVGKLNVVRVEENLAVAEIVPGSIVEGQSIQPGDTLFF